MTVVLRCDLSPDRTHQWDKEIKAKARSPYMYVKETLALITYRLVWYNIAA